MSHRLKNNGRSSSCHGSPALGFWHHKDCRPGRPMCHVRRQLDPKRKVCTCSAYFFPHRTGSGPCGDQQAMWAQEYGMTIAEVRKRSA